jgi:UDP-N-acetylglucosamine--N-acetylmuramyl-(pentapeptide) pyrophosphoryl-undecaprenol N-acetylglucosamine transferase
VVNAPEGAELEKVGNPIRDAARAVMAEEFDPHSGKLLVFGGSQGASLFARLVPAAVAQLPEHLRAGLTVAQQAREGEVAEVSAAYAASGVVAEVAPFFDDLPQRIASASLVIARAGASTIAELTAIGRPSILVPYAAAMDDHQTANASPLAEAGAAILAPEHGLTAEAISGQMRAILEAPEKASAMAAAAKAQGAPDAASRLADLVEAVANRQRSTH